MLFSNMTKSTLATLLIIATSSLAMSTSARADCIAELDRAWAKIVVQAQICGKRPKNETRATLCKRCAPFMRQARAFRTSKCYSKEISSYPKVDGTRLNYIIDRATKQVGAICGN